MTTKTTKKQTLADIRETLKRGDRDCKAEGEALWTMVERLIFWGANAYEFRGLSDAKLSAKIITELHGFSLPPRALDQLSCYIDSL